LRLGSTRRLMCHLRHDLFYGGTGLRFLSVAPPTVSQPSSSP
jgi:hypothetical protein